MLEATIPGDATGSAAFYNGVFTVTAVPNATTFTYAMQASPAGDASGARFRGSEFQFPIENLRPLASLTWGPVGNRKLITAIMAPVRYAATPNSQEHGLDVGDIFKMLRAGRWDSISGSPYNKKNFQVVAVIPGSPGPPAVPPQFQFYLDTDPTDDPSAAGFSPGYFGRLWQFGRLLIENNIIELGTRPLNSVFGRLLAVFLYVFGSDPQFTGRQAVVRDNIIRHVDNGSDIAGYSRGLEIYKVQDILIQNNIISLGSDDTVTQARAMAYWRTDSVVETSSNWTAGGNLLQATLLDSSYTPAPELELTVAAGLEDALVAWCLGGSL
jgi:hypothetical protein